MNDRRDPSARREPYNPGYSPETIRAGLAVIGFLAMLVVVFLVSAFKDGGWGAVVLCGVVGLATVVAACLSSTRR